MIDNDLRRSEKMHFMSLQHRVPVVRTVAAIGLLAALPARLAAGSEPASNGETPGPATTAADPSGDYYDWKKSHQPERPYIRRYDQTLVMKIFLAEKKPDNGCKVYLTFEQALAVIKRLDNITCGAPKIVYLVGWQHNGHDSKYPDWSVVNPRLKRAQDATAVDSLKWLMAEGFKHHTTVSLHINMLDAYEDSPLWKEYLDRDIIAKEKDGRPLPGREWGGQRSYPISYAREWETGCARKRIDGLLAMLPIQRAGTVHIDAFHTYPPRPKAQANGNPPQDRSFAGISPFLGYPAEKEAAAQRKVYRYFRDRGVDVTSERSTSYRLDPLVGLQPMAWSYNPPAAGIPPSLYCGTPMRAEPQVKRDPTHLTGLLDEFCVKAVPWLWSNAWQAANNQKPPQSADWDRVRQGDDYCIPLAWKKEATLLAYSRNGCEMKVWQLPAGWEKAKRVQLAEITLEGSRPLVEVPVQSGAIRLTLKGGQAVTVTSLMD
jgi:hypothetical protein